MISARTMLSTESVSCIVFLVLALSEPTYLNRVLDVTMVQRSPTYVMSTKNGMPILLGGSSLRLIYPRSQTDAEYFAAFYAENGPPTDVADRLSASYPNKFVKLLHQRLTKAIAEADKYV